jgi:hypothetical protein
VVSIYTISIEDDCNQSLESNVIFGMRLMLGVEHNFGNSVVRRINPVTSPDRKALRTVPLFMTKVTSQKALPAGNC